MEHPFTIHAAPPFALPGRLWHELLAHLVSCLPNEGVGYLAGPASSSPTLWLPLDNELQSPTRFRASPGSALRAHKRMRATGTDILAVVHSHPTSDPIPSATDLRANPLGEAIPWLIVGLRGRPTSRLWRLGESATELAWGVVGDG